MKNWIIFAAFFALVSFNSCDYTNNNTGTENVAQSSIEDAQTAAIQQKLAEKQQSGEITEEQAAALLLLILAAMAEQGDAASGGFYNNSNQVGNSGYTEDEVMDMVVDQAINPVGVIDYNY